MSASEPFTVSTTDQTCNYDGFIIFVTNIGSHLEVYLNDDVVAVADYGGGSTSNRRNSITLPVNKGDKVKVAQASGTATARWYKERY